MMATAKRITHHPLLGDLPPAEPVKFSFDGRPVTGREGDTISAALWAAGLTTFDPPASGIYCGIGHCFSCRVTVDGAVGVRGCLVKIRPGMQVESDRTPQLGEDADAK